MRQKMTRLSIICAVLYWFFARVVIRTLVLS